MLTAVLRIQICYVYRLIHSTRGIGMYSDFAKFYAVYCQNSSVV
uniref:Uncharacterized protein n=1 Tax=Ciona intestinalis TaxID=7719 RepID=H2XLG5_CIOIN